MLLEKHWISLKMVPIAFPVNVSKLISKKGLNFSLFFFVIVVLFEFCLRQIREYFNGTFYQSFLFFIIGIYISMALWNLTNIQKQ